ncbi:GNAT family N-acetyltransferase [Demequina sp.]|uniref:GNAT family N-acetyltransferase n=1 Tax=Demequina sp. TaxID=2050685 RepID=UPI003A8B1D9B
MSRIAVGEATALADSRIGTERVGARAWQTLPMYTVPHRIETSRLVIRRYEETDAQQLVDVVVRNMDHLRRYMEWIAFEPQTLEQRREFIASTNAAFDSGKDYTLGMFDLDGVLVGGTGFHVRTRPERLEIGYWIDELREGQGLVTEAAAALTRVGLTFTGATLMDISHAASNARSAAVPRRLGFAPHDAGGPEVFDDGNKVARTSWWATRDTLGGEAFDAHPYPRVFDSTNTELTWP